MNMDMSWTCSVIGYLKCHSPFLKSKYARTKKFVAVLKKYCSLKWVWLNGSKYCFYVLNWMIGCFSDWLGYVLHFRSYIPLLIYWLCELIVNSTAGYAVDVSILSHHTSVNCLKLHPPQPIKFYKCLALCLSSQSAGYISVVQFI